MILDEILANKRREVAERIKREPIERVAYRAAQASPARDFAGALRGPGVSIISEIKRQSPAKGALRLDMDAPTMAATYAAAGASCISVLTDEKYFKGSDADLVAVRQRVQEDPFANGLPDAQRHQPDRPVAGAFLDGDGAREEDGHQFARLPLGEQLGVGLEGPRLDVFGELVNRRVGEAGEEVERLELFADVLGHGGPGREGEKSTTSIHDDRVPGRDTVAPSRGAWRRLPAAVASWEGQPRAADRRVDGAQRLARHAADDTRGFDRVPPARIYLDQQA